jgi:dTDP-4-dehydrorhamnose 3,5-epimerase
LAITVSPTPLEGVLLVDPDFFSDERGFFLESYHRQRFAESGIPDEFVQDNHSRSHANVLRGIHYQDLTAPMGKLLRCTQGGVFDVAVDLRAGAPTFGKWFGVELTATNMRQIWIPPGFGHAFLTLADGSEVQYKCTGYYTPSAEGAVAWNDPEIGIEWPVRDPIVSDRDAKAMSLREYLQRPAFTYPPAGRP